MNKILLSCVSFLLYGCNHSTIANKEIQVTTKEHKKIVENEIETNPKPDPQAHLLIKCGRKYQDSPDKRLNCIQKDNPKLVMLIDPPRGIRMLGTTRGEETINKLNIKDKNKVILYVNIYKVKGNITLNVAHKINSEYNFTVITIETKNINTEKIIIKDGEGEPLVEYIIERH